MTANTQPIICSTRIGCAGSSTVVETTAMPEYKAAEALIKQEKFDEAIKALNAMNKPEDPDVLSVTAVSP